MNCFIRCHHHVDKEVEDLLLCAQEARVRAYTPYSKFRVGAALLTEDGSLVPGCNVENISFGLTICAERNAIARAVGEGHRTFKAIGVVADMKDKFVTPCGACRQVIVEFSVDCEVYLGRPDGAYVKTTIDKLLPDAFTPHVANLESLTK
ncbi:Cytidine deaminase [Armadillidium vulgare]|nr:Cytidine deaminase [Armadillidium vulgare]